MEKEVTEVLEEGVVGDELTQVNHKPSKALFLGIAAVATVTGLLLAFRKKIDAKIVGSMVKKLTKKGYTVCQPTPEMEDVFSDNVLEPLE